jgi:ABC-type transport system involved in cytochrome bd biosynthesis fused ATPase/permease subunit
MLTGGDPLTIERTLQLAIAPAFILTGAMAVLNLLSTRLQRLVDRQRDLVEADERERIMIRRRIAATHGAMAACVLCAVAICLLVIVAFVEPVFGIGAGTHIVVLMLVAMVSLTAALALFFWEVMRSGGDHGPGGR